MSVSGGVSSPGCTSALERFPSGGRDGGDMLGCDQTSAGVEGGNSREPR